MEKKPEFVREMEISPQPSRTRSEWLRFRLRFGKSSSWDVEFDLKPSDAMTLMRELQDFQRRYRWQVPIVRVEKPSKKS